MPNPKRARHISEWPRHKDLDFFIKEACIRALKFFNGNQSRAAEALGISIRTFRNYKAKYDLANYSAYDNEWQAEVSKFEQEFKIEK